MLLMQLQTKEKFAFLELAHHLARIDDDFGENEKEVILEYCAEMGIEDMLEYDSKTFILEEVLKDFKSKKSQKILLLELMILVHADDRFDFKEHILIDTIAEFFVIDKQTLSHYSSWGKAVTALYMQGKLFLQDEG
ncbi:MAG: TerB family tellurite resistance protein [Candidatus Marinarcus sp.]|uniref:TerB family tellurite resistance protein n=1 Tax=Candidatus Marinarcus sp. TaxID=3100987 RepID=UPI003B00261B